MSRLRLLVAIAVVAVGSAVVVRDCDAVNASPRPVRARQPDGGPISLQIRGNEFHHWYEDQEGYPVVAQWPRGAAKPLYVYAQPLARDAAVEASDRVVGRDAPPAGLQRNVVPPVPRGREAREHLLPQVNWPRAALPPMAAKTAAGPEVVRVPNLVILMRFKNHRDSGRTLPTVADFEKIFNVEGGHPAHVRNGVKSGSVRDFYLENSYGRFELNSTIVDWVDLDNTEKFYADGDSGGTFRIKQAIKEALDKVQERWAGQPDSPTFENFDQDGNGSMDAVAFVHSGYGAEWGGDDADGADFKDRIWSHRWSIPTWTSNDGVKVSDYHINPALWDTRGSEPGHIGVICHETGHFFGLPDLYDTSQQGEGIGSWGVMANSWGFDGTQLHPPHFCAWSKIQLGWAKPTVLQHDGQYEVRQAETDEATIYKITGGFDDAKEYLLIENRQPVGYDRKIVAGTGGRGGLAIWHIDDGKPANNDPGWPGGPNMATHHYRVAVLQADGVYDLEQGRNRGDGDDVFREGFVTEIGSTTTPATAAYAGGGEAVTITDISTSAEVMTFRVTGLGEPPIEPPDEPPDEPPVVAQGGLAASAEYVWDADNPKVEDANATILQASLDLPEEMEVHIQASSSVRTDAADGVLFTTGFYHQETDQFLMWPGSFRYVQIPKPQQWGPVTPTYAVRLPAGAHTIYWKIWLDGDPVEFDSATLTLAAHSVSQPSAARATRTLRGVGPKSRADRRGANENRPRRKASAQRAYEKTQSASSAPAKNGGSFHAVATHSPNAGDDAATPPEGKFALLIGINEYLSNDISDLRGCVNDVEEMKNLLTGKFQFLEDNIRTLPDEQATHARIVQAFQEDILAKADAYKTATGKKPIVVFHYSGHGSQVVDTSRDEVDGLDETIVPHDSIEPEDDITDDELNSLFKQLSAVTDSVTYIFDSCHSGTATKGIGQPRLVERELPVPEPGAVDPSEEQLDYALITGCLSKQRSYEYQHEGKYYGTLTFFLRREIEASGEEQVTWRDIMDKVQRKVSAVRPQNPQLAGTKMDSFVFSDSGSVAEPYVLVDPNANGAIVHAGDVHGLTPGSVLEVYRPGTKKFDNSVPSEAQIELTEVDPYESRGKVLSGGPIPAAARAVVRVHSMKSHPMPVFFDLTQVTHGDVVEDAATLDKIKTAMATDKTTAGHFKVAESLDESKLAVAVRSDGKIHVTGYRIKSSPISKTDDDAVPRTLAQLRHWGRWFNTLVLDNPNAELQVAFSIDGPQRPADDDGLQVFFHDDPVEFKVTNQSETPFYFGVLDLAEDGSISLVYPPAGEAEQLGAGKTWVESSTAFVPDGEKQVFDYLKLVVLDKPVNLRFMTLNATPKGKWPGKDDPNRFPFSAAVLQGKGVRPVEPKAWTTALADMKVVAP